MFSNLKPVLKFCQCIRSKQGSIPIFYKQPLMVEINRSRKKTYLLEHTPHRIYRLYFSIQQILTIGMLTSFSPFFSLPFFSISLFFFLLFLSFLSLSFFLLISFMFLPSSTNWYHLPFIHIPTCMHVDTWLAMCHPKLTASKNVKFRLSWNSTTFS